KIISIGVVFIGIFIVGQSLVAMFSGCSKNNDSGRVSNSKIEKQKVDIQSARVHKVTTYGNFSYKGDFSYIELDLMGEAREKENLEIILSALDEFEKQNNRDVVTFWIDKQQSGQLSLERVFGVFIKSKLK
ncbi:MAG: hypothetical protein HYW78_04060, partial [Parcubacteria group bacterium]|nr:hypothetical protein [Parcubacteria group bacterium]